MPNFINILYKHKNTKKDLHDTQRQTTAAILAVNIRTQPQVLKHVIFPAFDSRQAKKKYGSLKVLILGSSFHLLNHFLISSFPPFSFAVKYKCICRRISKEKSILMTIQYSDSLIDSHFSFSMEILIRMGTCMTVTHQGIYFSQSVLKWTYD